MLIPLRAAGALSAFLLITAIVQGQPARGMAATVTVQATDRDTFVPATITVHVGDTLRWINASQQIHTITDDVRRAAYAGDALLPAGAAPFHSGYLKPGAVFEHTFSVAGAYHYFCIPHEGLGMLGSVVVLPAGSSTGVAPAASPRATDATATSTAEQVVADPVAFPSPVFVTLQRTGAIEAFPQQIVWGGFPQAHYISSGPGGGVLLIGGFQNGMAYLADGKNGARLAAFSLGGLIQGVKIDPQGHYGLVVDAGLSRLAVIDLKTRKLVRMIPVGKTPHNVTFAPNGSRAYVTIQGGRAIDVIDMETLAVKRVIELPNVNGPHNIDLAPDFKTAWVRSYGQPNQDGEAVDVNLRSGRIVHDSTVGFYHGGIDIRPLGSYVFTSNIGANTVDVLNSQTGSVIQTITVGSGPHGIRESADGKWLYVATTKANTLVVIDTKTLSIVQTIPLKGINPFWIAVVGNE